jgi:hypothetical protein
MQYKFYPDALLEYREAALWPPVLRNRDFPCLPQLIRF